MSAQEDYRARIIALGLCQSCKVRPVAPEKKTCVRCVKMVAEKGREKWGWTAGMYDAALIRQSGLCEICSAPMCRSKTEPAADHCHRTLRPRGLLCADCNITLGRYEKGWRPGGETISAFEVYLARYRNPQGNQ